LKQGQKFFKNRSRFLYPLGQLRPIHIVMFRDSIGLQVIADLCAAVIRSRDRWAGVVSTRDF